MSVEYFRDEDGQWRFRIKSGNGEIVAASEAYVSESNARRGAKTLFSVLEPDFDGNRVTLQTDELTPQEREQKIEELLDAAWCYLSVAREGIGFDLRQSPMAWPWDRKLWQPGTRNENMTKASRYLFAAKKLYNEREEDG